MNRRNFILSSVAILTAGQVPPLSANDEKHVVSLRAARATVANRGKAPIDFLNNLISWGHVAPSEIFAVNHRYDVYSHVKSVLGPWKGLLHRRASMLEVLRVLAGFESSWNWQEGRDVTNASSNTPCTEEAGIFQCSGDSMAFGEDLKKLVEGVAGSRSCNAFILATKSNKQFAMEYCSRLLRHTVKHHGPLKRREIHDWLSREAVVEFESALKSKTMEGSE